MCKSFRSKVLQYDMMQVQIIQNWMQIQSSANICNCNFKTKLFCSKCSAQNVQLKMFSSKCSAQNIQLKMFWTNWAEHFEQNILSRTFWAEHFELNILSWTFWTFWLKNNTMFYFQKNCSFLMRNNLSNCNRNLTLEITGIYSHNFLTKISWKRHSPKMVI